MRNKTPLVIMEQIIMILVFTVAAALCMQVFVYSNKLSVQNQQRDNAVLLAQNMAERLKYSKEEVASPIFFDENLQPINDAEEFAYMLAVDYDNSDPYLWIAKITVQQNCNEDIFELAVAGQRWEASLDG